VRTLSPARQTLLEIAEGLFQAGVLRLQPAGAASAAARRAKRPAAVGALQPTVGRTAAVTAVTTPTTRSGRADALHPAIAEVPALGGATAHPGDHPAPVPQAPTAYSPSASPPAGLASPRSERADPALRATARTSRTVRPLAGTALSRSARPPAAGNPARADFAAFRKQHTGTTIQGWTRLVEAYLWHHSVGNPRAIVEMIGQLGREPAITEDAARNLEYPGARPQLDLTPFILIPAVFLVAARFVARGLGDTEAYILAGVGAALVMGLQFLLFRLRR